MANMSSSVLCTWCIAAPATHQCKDCRTAVYCGSECQQAHWAFHQTECDARVTDELQYTLLRGKIAAQMRWYTKVKRKSPPFTLLAQQQTLAILEQNKEKVQDNAWKWAMAWPDIQLKGDGVKVVKQVPTRFARGKRATKTFTEVVEHKMVRARDLWYPLLIEYSTSTDKAAVDGKIGRFFSAIAPLNAYSQKKAEKATQAWYRHTQLIGTAQDAEDDVYYEKAVVAVKQAQQLGQEMTEMLKRK